MRTKTKKTIGKLSAPTKPVIRTFFIDENGDNKVMVKSTVKTKTIHLLLKGENRKRLVGTITRSTKAITIKRKRQEHLFRAGNAYGFNAYILREAKDFDTIMLSDEFSHWRIPVKFILEHGKHLLFSQVGYELQLFVSLEQLEQYRVKPIENRRF
jgi:hypothetical protein